MRHVRRLRPLPAVIVLLLLAACGDALPDDARFFASAGSCAAGLSEAACEAAWAKAAALHEHRAPIFMLRRECETVLGDGNCDARRMPSGGDYYVARMKGMLTTGRGFAGPVYDQRGFAVALTTRGAWYVGRFGGFNAEPKASRDRREGRDDFLPQPPRPVHRRF